jgi:hypothetical protein
MDYITELPETAHGNKHTLVIVDRLGKGAMFIPCPDLTGETLANLFVQRFVSQHLLPTAITSDRGDQFVQGVWAHICRILKIEQRLSTAYHPETDGQTERMNQTLEEYLRHFCTYYQDDWDAWLPLAEAAINTRTASSTGVSPFFLSHGYHPRLGEGIDFPIDEDHTPRNPIESAQQIISKLRSCVEFAQSTMAHAQQCQQEIHDRRRDPAPTFRVGDRVWLDLRNIQTNRPKKKLSELHSQYKVTEVISGSAYRLDTPPGIGNVFHVSLLRPVATDPLPSQAQDDTQTPPVLIEGEEEWGLEEIVNDRVVRGRGRGGPLKRQFLCRWRGYAELSWTDAVNCEDTVALDKYEEKTGRKVMDEPLVAPPKRKGRGGG